MAVEDEPTDAAPFGSSSSYGFPYGCRPAASPAATTALFCLPRAPAPTSLAVVVIFNHSIGKEVLCFIRKLFASCSVTRGL